VEEQQQEEKGRKNRRGKKSPQVTGRRMTRGMIDLPDQRRVYVFMVKEKGWTYVPERGWSVVGPEDGCKPLEEAELPQYVFDRPELLAEYNEYEEGKAAGESCSPAAREPHKGERRD
ncbi:unnamed protein product, partial [Ectocarpus fasciculatus]